MHGLLCPAGPPILSCTVPWTNVLQRGPGTLTVVDVSWLGVSNRSCSRLTQMVGTKENKVRESVLYKWKHVWMEKDYKGKHWLDKCTEGFHLMRKNSVQVDELTETCAQNGGYMYGRAFLLCATFISCHFVYRVWQCSIGTCLRTGVQSLSMSYWGQLPFNHTYLSAA